MKPRGISLIEIMILLAILAILAAIAAPAIRTWACKRDGRMDCPAWPPKPEPSAADVREVCIRGYVFLEHGRSHYGNYALIQLLDEQGRATRCATQPLGVER